ncbi:MAG TPA: DUF4442 domain-containing protein [Taishania sp.]|nr:DUF4442 domain-containing protein [Taishania sp.]
MLFQTNRKESVKTRFQRLIFNFIPAYWCTGAKIRFISEDWKEVHITLKKKIRTRNLVGSVFGGSIYAAADPIYMTQLLFILGKNYVVWDKSATVDFKKPIYKKAKIKFEITDEQLAEIKSIVDRDGRCNYTLKTKYTDEQGNIMAEITKVLYIASKSYYKEKKR